MRVLIAGGGTGGLATANALRKIGVDALVLEQAQAFTAIGAGLGLQVNAMRALTYIGADAYWRANVSRIDEGRQANLEDGETIATSSNAAQVEKYGEHYYCGHRADLMQSLLEPLAPESVRTGARVVALEETSEGVRVELETGEELRGDLLVGADGLRSTVRTLLFGEQEARFTDTVVWRGLMPRERVPEEYSEKILSWLGPRRHVLVYPLRHRDHPESVFSFSGFVPAAEVHRESWTASGDLEDLRKSLEGACPAVHELLDCMQGALITGIYFRDPLESWGTDRIVLLGDAAHPAPPSAGQGAGMALEDAVMLAECLRRNGPGNEREALREYVYRRRPRTERMLEASRVNLLNSQTSDPVQVRARNGYYRGLRKLSPVSPPMGEWLLGHDPVKAALQSPEEFAATRLDPPNPMVRPEAQQAYDAWRTALSREHRARGWVMEREGYDEFLRRTAPDLGTFAAEAISWGAIEGFLVSSKLQEPSEDSPVVVHLHGGAYVMGSARGSVDLAGRLAEAVAGRAVTIDYRLAPEHPFPAALDDAMAAYDAVAERFPSSPIVLSGECAGAGIALALLLSRRDRGLPMPLGVHLVSPFCDLTADPDALNKSAKDPWFNQIVLTEFAACYVQDAEPGSPYVSPALGDLSGLPPTLIQVARDEALFPTAERLAARLESSGVEVTSFPAEDSVHSFVLFRYLPESGTAVEQFEQFVRGLI